MRAEPPGKATREFAARRGRVGSSEWLAGIMFNIPVSSRRDQSYDPERDRSPDETISQDHGNANCRGIELSKKWNTAQ